MASPREQERVLLVEFLADDPLDQYRSENYPFLQGYIRRQGGSCEWVVLAAGADARPRHPHEVRLPPPRMGRLLAVAEASRPTLVVLNERLWEGDAEALRKAAATARVINPPEKPPDISGLTRETPDYECRRLDPEVEISEPYQQILVEPRCLYRRTVRSNPLYAGVDVDSLEHQFGCAFCPKGRTPRAIPSPDEALEQVMKQFQAYHATAPAEMRRDRFLLFAVPMLPMLDVFVERLLQMEFPPAELHITCRIDNFLRVSEAVRRALPLLKRAGFELHLWQVGLENYSEQENQRFNKGVSVEQVERFVTLVDELEREWPETFVFGRHGGFAMILFTPWTRVEDLRANLEGLRRHGRTNVGAFMARSHLRLRTGTPIAALAMRDGLTLEAAGVDTDALFSAHCITEWGENDLPWRFGDPSAQRIYRFMVALTSDGKPPDNAGDDALRARLLRENERSEVSAYRLLEVLVEAHERGAKDDDDTMAFLLAQLRVDRLHRLLTAPLVEGDGRDPHRADDPLTKIQRKLPSPGRTRELLQAAVEAAPHASDRDLIRYTIEHAKDA